MPQIELTLLNAMAGSDFVAALDRHVAWHLRHVDLKDAIFGKNVADLTEDDVEQVAALLSARDLSVHCLSTTLMYRDVELGEPAFHGELHALKQMLPIVRPLKPLDCAQGRPAVVRLLSASTARRGDVADATAYVRDKHPWLIDIYREGIDLIAAAGFVPMIENEVGRSIFSNPDEILSFFDALDRPAVRLIYDVVNLWQMGTFPSLDVYERLKPLIGGVHLKGGQSGTPGGPLKWAATLEDSNWPVLPMVRRVAADGTVPVIALNPPHGQRREGYDYVDLAGRDIEYLRRSVREIA